MENLTESRSSVIGLATKKFHERCMPFVWKRETGEAESRTGKTVRQRVCLEPDRSVPFD